MKIKKLVALTMVAVSMLSLSACAMDKTVVSYNSKTTVSFSWWGNDSRHAYTIQAVDKYEEKNSDIKIDFNYAEWNGYEKRYNARMESHTQADVMQINYAWLSKYSPDGEGYYDLYELKDYLDLSGYTEEDLKYGEVNGKLNAVPIALNTPTVYFNKDIFDEHGLDVPKDWDEYFEAAKVLKKDNIYVLGMAKKHLFLFLIAYYEQSEGKKVFDEDGRLVIDREGVEKIVSFYQELLEAGVLMKVDDFSINEFSNGNCAGVVAWVSDAGNYCGELESSGGHPVVAEYPLKKGAKRSGWYIKPATMYAISKDTANPEEAAKLLDYLINSEEMAMLQKTEKGVPTSRKALGYLEANGELGSYESLAYDELNDNISNFELMVPELEDDAIISLFKSETDKLFYNQIDFDECVDNIYTGMKELAK